MRSLLWLMLFLPVTILAQQDTVPEILPDTVAIPQVEVNAYSTAQNLKSATNAIDVVDAEQLRRQPNNTSFVSVLNQVPGVRMEERSPGSYRFSIRGSLLRSPFGIRNVKFYLMGELPFTDASGNTYFNLFDFSAINKIELVKGPDASAFGANSGGVVVLYPDNPPQDTSLTVHLAGGSFGTAKEDIGFKKTWKQYSLQINQAYQRTDGYRRNSQMQRHFLQAVQRVSYRDKGQLTLYHLFSKLQYETPGGLTEAQAANDPTAARAPTATLPGATQQQAGIINTTTYHGLTNEWNFKLGLRHVVSAWGSYTDFKNPFITNYEVRQEHTLGARTFVEWNGRGKAKRFSWINGYEYLYTFTDFKNYGNRGGNRDTLQVADNLKAQQQFLFSRINKTFAGRLLVEASLSLNFFSYHYQNQYPTTQESYTHIVFKPQLMPRIGVSLEVVGDLFIRASVSRGYSPPTLAEVRPSTNIISTNLQAEQGWNYEVGMHYAYRKGQQEVFSFRPTVYYFRLNDAIVRREDTNGAEYFVNAGGTSQIGFELSGNINLLPFRDRAVTQVTLSPSYTYQHFKFRDYQLGSETYTGNWLTGVPRHMAAATLAIDLLYQLNISVTYNYTSDIPLNDANDLFAEEYHLLQARIGYKVPIKKRELELYLSGDNLLNQRYSLGNDINAFGGRYYNPAPSANFLGGVKIRI